jgi:hypothetical protein
MTINQLSRIPNNIKIFIIFVKNNILIIKIITAFGIFFHVLYKFSAYFINLLNYFICEDIIKKINVQFLLQAVFTSCYLYRYYLKLKGLGFTIKYLVVPKHTLLFNLGFSKVRYIQIPQVIKIIKKPRKKKHIFTLFSPNNKLLVDFAYLIRKLKIPDPYKLKGFRYIKETLVVKTGKKKK